MAKQKEGLGRRTKPKITLRSMALQDIEDDVYEEGAVFILENILHRKRYTLETMQAVADAISIYAKKRSQIVAKQNALRQAIGEKQKIYFKSRKKVEG